MDYEVFILSRMREEYDATGSTDTALIRALLVPAVVSLFGQWNWWLPERPARWLRVEPSLPRPAPAET